MALMEEGNHGLPVFEHPAIPFLQLLWLDLDVGGERCHRISTYQNDDNFGLCVQLVARDAHCFDGIYRVRELSELAGEQIGEVFFLFDEIGDIAEVRLGMSSLPELTLVAGEVEETASGVIVRRPDESVLLFWQPADAAKVSFGTEIQLAT